MADKDSVPGIAIGFIVGAAVGLAAALLLAPKSGKETRELLKDRTTDIPETIREHTANREKVYKQTWHKRKGQSKLSGSYFE
jgi:gas vesicle protein